MVKETNPGQKYNHFYKKPDDEINFDASSFNGYDFEDISYTSIFNLPRLGKGELSNEHGELGFKSQVKNENIFFKFI